jgi:hypothetical protein
MHAPPALRRLKWRAQKNTVESAKQLHPNAAYNAIQ